MQSPQDGESVKTTPDPSTLTPDLLCQLLANPIRRRILLELKEGETPMSVDTLVDRVHPGLESTSSESITPDELRLRFHHVHLPPLEVHGLLEWDEKRNDVTYRSSERVEHLLELFEQWDDQQ